MILSLIPTVGFLGDKNSVIDIGIILTILSHFFINRNIPLTILNTLFMVGFLFLFIGVWLFVRYFLLVSKIEDSARKGSGDLISFTRPARKFTVRGIFTNILLGAFLSIIASFMGSYSSLGRITTGRIEVILMILFTSALFLVIYKMISIMASEEN
ncbi:MAG: hypothetical protein ACOCTN_07940 [Candidatus Natronoplasma sp.]